MNGIYLLDKPEGISSYGVIKKFKKAFNLNKVGHAGTLDPFATGLLIVLVGKATKLSDIFINGNKKYQGTISFGAATDTYDKTGIITEEKSDFLLTDQMVKSALNLFTGELMQTPPIYSAIRYDGMRLYEYAREAIEVEIKKRKVFVYEFSQTGRLKDNKQDFTATVSKGTYLRSLAYDVGKHLNIPSHLEALRRTKSGMFNVVDAYKLEDINSNTLPTYSLEDYAKGLPKLTVLPYLEKHVLNGILLDERQTTIKDYISVYNEAGELLAIYMPIEDKYKPLIIVKEK